MISDALIKKIRKIEIKTGRVIEEVFSGNYRSAFKGNGMEFEEIREYYEGDDIRNIDWNVTARQNRPYIKKYREERELNIVLMVDVSSSNDFGNQKEKTAEIVAAMSLAGVKNGDRVGAILFSDKIEKHIYSRKGSKHALSIIENILTTLPEKRKTNLNSAIEYFERAEKKSSVLIIVSDFLCENYEKSLKRVSIKHDVILIRTVEKTTQKIPKGAIFMFEDLETGEIIEVDSTTSEINLTNEFIPKHKNLVTIYSDEEIIKPLMIFFKRRAKS
jgi:Mg-chelatase subunit ChlD